MFVLEHFSFFFSLQFSFRCWHKRLRWSHVDIIFVFLLFFSIWLIIVSSKSTSERHLWFIIINNNNREYRMWSEYVLKTVRATYLHWSHSINDATPHVKPSAMPQMNLDSFCQSVSENVKLPSVVIESIRRRHRVCITEMAKTSLGQLI